MQICVRNVSKRYKRKQGQNGFRNNLKAIFRSQYEYIDAIREINMEIQQGEIVGYIGANGSGKSTTIKMLCGILSPDSGEIMIEGRKVDIRNRDLKKKIGVVFGQRSNLWNDLPPIDTFQLYKCIYDIDENTYRDNYEFINSYLDIASVENIAVRKLSLGQRMKCEICAAMLHFPDILFLDEPTIGLDVNLRKSVVSLLKEYNRKFEKTIVITSHNLYDIDELCSRVIIIDNGRILVDETLDGIKTLYQKYKFVELQYTDENAKNIGNNRILEIDGIKLLDEFEQLNKQTYKLKINDDVTMNKLMQFIVHNKSIVNFQVYQESLESIVGNIIG